MGVLVEGGRRFTAGGADTVDWAPEEPGGNGDSAGAEAEVDPADEGVGDPGGDPKFMGELGMGVTAPGSGEEFTPLGKE